jgi:hypothetical protein
MKPRYPAFDPGRLFITPGAQRALAEAGQTPVPFLARHFMGDWGDVDAEDAQANDQSLKDGTRLLSAYHTAKGVKLWVITEAADEMGRRSATTVLLADEY